MLTKDVLSMVVALADLIPASAQNELNSQICKNAPKFAFFTSLWTEKLLLSGPLTDHCAGPMVLIWTKQRGPMDESLGSR
jgi:hypothetical protein